MVHLLICFSYKVKLASGTASLELLNGTCTCTLLALVALEQQQIVRDLSKLMRHKQSREILETKIALALLENVYGLRHALLGLEQ
jgi:hypothetical protein